MHTLVIHPRDKSTDFLQPIYDRMHNVTVLREWPGTEDGLNKMIDRADRVIGLGHGGPHGLFSMGLFPREPLSQRNKNLFTNNDKNIYVWCHAADFCMQSGVRGFATGMFISEEIEAHIYQIQATKKEITKSNNQFAEVLGDLLLELGEDYSPYLLYRHVMERYTLHSQVVGYNKAVMNHFELISPIDNRIVKHNDN